MSNKLAGVAGIIKYGVIGGIFVGISYVGWKIYQEFQKAKPPDTDEPFIEIPEGHGSVVRYKTIYVGWIVGWLFPLVNIHNTKTEFITHLEWVRNTHPNEMKVVECYCIMSDGYEHYLGVAYQCLNFQDDLPETTTISEKPEIPKYPPIRLESGEWYSPEAPITQEIYEQNIVEAKAFEEVISIIETLPEIVQYPILKLTEAEIREQGTATNIIINIPEPEPIIAPIISPIIEQEIVKPIYDIIEPTPEPLNVIISEPEPPIMTKLRGLM